MKDTSKIRDWRSTGRRIGRRTLYRSRRNYECETCGVTSSTPPKDAPSYFEEIWPIEEKAVKLQIISSQLQVQHLTKDVSENDESMLKWLCPSCHKLEDQSTGRGESLVSGPDFYGESA